MLFLMGSETHNGVNALAETPGSIDRSRAPPPHHSQYASASQYDTCATGYVANPGHTGIHCSNLLTCHCPPLSLFSQYSGDATSFSVFHRQPSMLQSNLFSYPPSSINCMNSSFVTGYLAIWNAETSHLCPHFSWPNTKGSVLDAPRRYVEAGTEIHEGSRAVASAVVIGGGGGGDTATTRNEEEEDDEEEVEAKEEDTGALVAHTELSVTIIGNVNVWGDCSGIATAIICRVMSKSSMCQCS